MATDEIGGERQARGKLEASWERHILMDGFVWLVQMMSVMQLHEVKIVVERVLSTLKRKLKFERKHVVLRLKINPGVLQEMLSADAKRCSSRFLQCTDVNKRE